MSNSTRLTHSGQVLLERAEKAFNEGQQNLGIVLLNDCVIILTNGLKNLETEQPAEQPASSQAESIKGGYPETKVEDSTIESGKPGSGVVSGPAESESKPDAGVVSEPDKSQNKPGSGVS